MSESGMTSKLQTALWTALDWHEKGESCSNFSSISITLLMHIHMLCPRCGFFENQWTFQYEYLCQNLTPGGSTCAVLYDPYVRGYPTFFVIHTIPYHVSKLPYNGKLRQHHIAYIYNMLPYITTVPQWCHFQISGCVATIHCKWSLMPPCGATLRAL